MKHVHNVIGARLQQVTRSGQTNEYAQLFPGRGVTFRIEENPAYWPTLGVECGWLFRPGSLWVGAHYSPTNRRWCINLLPMVTVWICLKGGVRP